MSENKTTRNFSGQIKRNDDKEPAGNKMRKIRGQKASKALINKEKNPENIEIKLPRIMNNKIMTPNIKSGKF